MDHLSRKLISAAFLLLVLALSTGVASAATSAAHTNLTIHRTPKGDVSPGTAVTFYGKLHSSAKVCRSGQTVQLIKVGSGVVATAVTDAGGHFTFAAQTVNTDSSFRATFAGSISGTHPNTRVCAGSTSRVLKVEVKGSTGGGVLGTGGGVLGAGGSTNPGSAFTGRELLGDLRLLAVLIITGLAAIVVSRRRLRAGRGI
jgi:hypothetical protein